MSSKPSGTYSPLNSFLSSLYLIIPSTVPTVPTVDQVFIPESLLKKRKTQEKTEAEREQERVEQKKVTISSF